MKLAEIKLDKITSIWNHFVWNYKSIQKQINFNEEVKTNYFGDILAYFHDTFPLINSYLEIKNENNQVFNTIGFLQIIYVQQDLMDEMLHIFKLPKSSNLDKNPNRTIRNELIGHPISRTSKDKGQKFQSSVFFGNELSISKIHYIKYSIDSNFKGIEIEYSTEEIIKRHIKFLNKYFNQILAKLKKILREFLKRIEEIKIIEKHTDFKKLVEIIESRYEVFFRQRENFAKENILKIEQLKDSHPRYKFSFDLFKKELIEYIDETNKYIKELLQKEKIKDNKEIDMPDKIVPIFTDFNKNNIDNNIIEKSDNMNYVLSKLYSNHPIFGIEYFKKRFKDNQTILAELNNMELNIDNKMEYFCSYEYLRKGILKK